tara:strand:- start:1514 stop:2935 length:1422 start_codon:yes stop_codon:yes gene_type:complete
MNYKNIIYFLGVYSFIISAFSILNILYSFYFDFFLGLNSYLLTFIISILIGLLFCFIGYKNHQNISLSEQILFILLSFLFLPLLISIPYYSSIYGISFLDSYFEAVSGITTTGFSALYNVSNIDEPLTLWRSSSQWVGGLLFLAATIGTFGSKQIRIKPSFLVPGGNSSNNFYNNFNYNFIKIFLIYFLSTIFVIFLYKLANIRLLDSVNLALTTMSSGGFVPSNELSDIITHNLQVFVLGISLLFPILNFYFLFNIFTKQFNLKNHQEDLHLLVLIIFLTSICYFFLIPERDFVNILLAITSSISTSGIFIQTSYEDLSLFFILLTFVGGSLISTSSGFKYIRIYILLKISHQEIYRLVKPINVFDKNLFNTESKIDDYDLKIAFLVFISFIVSVFILSSILSLDIVSFENSFKLSILTLTSTVNSEIYGLYNLSFFDLNGFTKLSLIFFMIIGKIEIISILYLVKRLIFRN